MSHQTLSLQAKDLGFRVAAKRIEELQALVGEAASGNDSPQGIPPPRAKPAGVKPDPKARPFTPGTHCPEEDYSHQVWCQDGRHVNTGQGV